MQYAKLPDHFIIDLYEYIRDRVSADTAAGIRFLDSSARQRAHDLSLELEHRGLSYTPIDWPKPN